MAIYVGSYDWGPCINKIVFNIDQKINPDELNISDFIVDRILYQKDAALKMTNGPLTITNVFCSDSKGKKINTASSYITILTDVYPTAQNSSPFPGFIASGVFENFYKFRITNEKLNIKISNVQGFVNEEVSKFSKDSFDFDVTKEKKEEKISLQYMFYFPENQNVNTKIPLILWFHSIGESGSNPYLVLLGTKTTALAGQKIQSHFKNGVAILAPQCPTGWLETTEENIFGIRYWEPVDIDGSVKKVTSPIRNFLNKFIDIKENETEPFAATSYYTEAITQMLYNFLEKHPEIDRNRIYVGGCSAGGYMTMNMMIQHPEIFAAAFPTCEYYLDNKISKKQIKQLAEKPLWFTYAENDPTVKPNDNCIPTINRLRDAGAKNLKVSVFPNVIDLSGKYLMDRTAKPGDTTFGLPYEYDGHYSWIYVLNDQCKDGNENLFDWLSKQSK